MSALAAAGADTSVTICEAAGAGPYLTVDEAASLLRISRKAFYAMRARGQLPESLFRKLPTGRLRVSRAELVAFVESCALSSSR